ncbi:MAG: hypothetical protein P8123_03225 [bacterium]
MIIYRYCPSNLKLGPEIADRKLGKLPQFVSRNVLIHEFNVFYPRMTWMTPSGKDADNAKPSQRIGRLSIPRRGPLGA